jgi:hypothetical protein
MSIRATSILLTLGLPSLFSSELLIWLLKNNFETMWFSEALRRRCRILHRCATDFVFKVFNYFQWKEEEGRH